MPFKGVLLLYAKRHLATKRTTEIIGNHPKGPNDGAFGKQIMKSDHIETPWKPWKPIEHHRKKKTKHKTHESNKAMLTTVTMETGSKPHKPYQH